jgi:hypothetical protein
VARACSFAADMSTALLWVALHLRRALRDVLLQYRDLVQVVVRTLRRNVQPELHVSTAATIDMLAVIMCRVCQLEAHHADQQTHLARLMRFGSDLLVKSYRDKTRNRGATSCMSVSAASGYLCQVFGPRPCDVCRSQQCVLSL